jgi:hypothetical protein
MSASGWRTDSVVSGGLAPDPARLHVENWVRCIPERAANGATAVSLSLPSSAQRGIQICKWVPCACHRWVPTSAYSYRCQTQQPAQSLCRMWLLIRITWAATMAIHRLLQNSPMGPEEIGRLVGAYRQTLHALGLKDRRDRLTELVAAKVFEIGQTGVGDAAEISRRAIQNL